MPEQLAFDLPARPARGRADFFVAPSNAAALALIDGPADWPDRKLALVGPPASGKTHLVHVWAEATGAEIVEAADLAATDPAAVAASRHVAVEDAERIFGSAEAEDRLFHLHNLLQSDGGYLLITGRQPPGRWSPTLPDLRSRLQGMTAAQLAPPDDALLAAVLVKHFADRQIEVQPNVVAFLLPRISRSFEAAADVVARLDRAALAQGQAVTRALARRVLDNDGADGA